MDKVNRIFTVFLIIVVILLFWLVATQKPQKPLIQNTGPKDQPDKFRQSPTCTFSLTERVLIWA